MKQIIKDTRNRTKARNEMDFMSKVAIVSGVVMLIALLYWAGAVTDAVIGLLELS